MNGSWITLDGMWIQSGFKQRLIEARAKKLREIMFKVQVVGLLVVSHIIAIGLGYIIAN